MTQWFKSRGIYDESERNPHGVRHRDATAIERRRLSAQSEFTYFLPYLPLAVCPGVPDVVAEFALAENVDFDVVRWKVDHQLIPGFAKRDIDTSWVFGLEGEKGKELPNFINGIVLQDESTKVCYRLRAVLHQMVEPTVSLARPAEKLLATQFSVWAIEVQSPEGMWVLDLANPPVSFKILYDRNLGGEFLWGMMHRFWKRNSRRDWILD